MSDQAFYELRLRLIRNELTDNDRLYLAECMRQIEERMKQEREERPVEEVAPF